MDARTFFVTGIAKTVSLTLHFALWLAIFMALAWGIRHRPAQPYGEGDEISPMFAVAELFYASNRLDANAFMTARYQIAADNKVIPVSFKVWSVGHGFLAFLLSFPVFLLVKRLMLRRRLGREKQPV